MVQEVRDPLHGAIAVETDELALIDHPAFQRLRQVRQLGFSELSFPGATHTRYLHSLGTMELASRAFEALFPAATFPDRDRWRAVVGGERPSEVRHRRSRRPRRCRRRHANLGSRSIRSEL